MATPPQDPGTACALRHPQAAIALGSNLHSARGDRAAHLRSALVSIDRTPGLRLIAASVAHETPALLPPDAPPGATAPPYLNAAAILETVLTPERLLAVMLDIERAHGRDRAAEGRWGSRTLDLDLLLLREPLGASHWRPVAMHAPGLTVPHPRMRERRFVLAPLAQIAADWAVPPDGATVAALLAALPAG